MKTEGTWSVDCTFTDDQGLSIYVNFRIIVQQSKYSWWRWLGVLVASTACILALLIYLLYLWDYHTRAINKRRLRRLNMKLRTVRNIEERFNYYRDIELKFYLPDPEDDFVLKNHQKPVENDDFNFNESDEEEYFRQVWMLRDR